jgi:transposase-like protein
MERKFNLIHEHEWTGNTVTNICKKYGVSRKTYYKWKNRYFNDGINGLRDWTSGNRFGKRVSPMNRFRRLHPGVSYEEVNKEMPYNKHFMSSR